MSIEAQAEEVDKVKRSENGVITDPFYLSPEHTLKDADKLMGSSGFLVFRSQREENWLVLSQTVTSSSRKISPRRLKSA